MGSANAYTPQKLVLGVLTSRPGAQEEILAAARGEWGPEDFVSPPALFTWSHYYDAEMGTPIQRFFVTFEGLVDPSCLAAIKARSNVLEERWRDGPRRTVNLDPGVLALSRFSLATTKDNAHRIPLSGGIYAEITLLFRQGSYSPMDWTYPDYRSGETIAMLIAIRVRYREQLRGDHGGPRQQDP
jgi:hypothetical protein